MGELLNRHDVTWGWFQGGFKPTSRSGGKAVCGSSHANIGGVTVSDYSAHHEPFQYYKATANPHHLPPSSVAMIGHTDQANHQYDLSDFWAAADHGNLPAVSFLKPAKYQDGHADYSDPLDEQHFIVNTINRLERLPTWRSTAIVIAYDDSDGWYDHVMPPIVSQSNDPANDALTGPGHCGTAAAGRLSRTAADTGRGCRCSSSRRGRGATPSTTSSPTRPRSCASSRTTGAWAGSATSRWTRRPARSTACSTSAARRTRTG